MIDTLKRVKSKYNTKTCLNCEVYPFCAFSNFSHFNSLNKKCPNYKEGIKEWKLLMGEYKGGERT